ncbi:nuclear transport factor 2 family protein [Flavisericum labens]|uniref:nuclear transport factor 2 family protein n=1 Tax=Flavisericum labens TaxID=3377112 RepID=UPI00387B0651
MESKIIVEQWFEKWNKGDFLNLPICESFKHTSPFGTIVGKKAYMDLVKQNQDKFLGYTFQINDAIYEFDKACVRYSAKQGENLALDVSEWYYFKDNLIEKIVSHYHIGQIREDRSIDNYI